MIEKWWWDTRELWCAKKRRPEGRLFVGFTISADYVESSNVELEPNAAVPTEALDYSFAASWLEMPALRCGMPKIPKHQLRPQPVKLTSSSTSEPSS